MRRAGLVVAFAVGGCDSVFSVDVVGRPDAALVCIEDTFDTMIDVTRWSVVGVSSGAVVGVVDGMLQIDVPPQTTPTQDPAGRIRSGSVSFVGAAAEVELVQVAAVGDPCLVGESVSSGPDRYELFAQRGMIVARHVIGGMLQDFTAPYVPDVHRFIRIRHDTSANEIAYEARGTDTPWSTLTSVPLEIDLAVTNLTVSAASFDIAPAYTAKLDNVRLLGPGCGP